MASDTATRLAAIRAAIVAFEADPLRQTTTVGPVTWNRVQLRDLYAIRAELLREEQADQVDAGYLPFLPIGLRPGRPRG